MQISPDKTPEPTKSCAMTDIAKEFKKLDGSLKDARIISLFLKHHLPNNRSIAEIDDQLYDALQELDNAISIWTHGEADEGTARS